MRNRGGVEQGDRKAGVVKSRYPASRIIDQRRSLELGTWDGLSVTAPHTAKGPSVAPMMMLHDCGVEGFLARMNIGRWTSCPQ
jgi:hypothetical protein